MSRRRHRNYYEGLILEISSQVAVRKTTRKLVRTGLQKGINSKQDAPTGTEHQCIGATQFSARAQWEGWGTQH